MSDYISEMRTLTAAANCDFLGVADLVRAETIQLVRRAIRELPAEQQQVVRMRIYENKTFAVIAAELGIPLGTALGRMRTALIKLRVKLERQR